MMFLMFVSAIFKIMKLLVIIIESNDMQALSLAGEEGVNRQEGLEKEQEGLGKEKEKGEFPKKARTLCEKEKVKSSSSL